MLGIILLVVGVIAFAVPSFTFFTSERAVDTGFFALDVKKPHTVIMNPGFGIAAMVVGGILLLTSKKDSMA